MKMNRNIPAVLGIGIAFCLMVACHAVQDEETEREKTEREKAKLSYMNSFLETNLFYFQSGEGQPLPHLKVLYPVFEASDSVLRPTAARLVLRIRAQHCNLCYEAEFRRLRAHSSQLGIENVIVLASFKKRDFRVMVKNFEKELPGVRYVNTLDPLPFKQESFNQPYYFVLEPDGITHSFFLPDKSLPEYSTEYFSSLTF